MNTSSINNKLSQNKTKQKLSMRDMVIDECKKFISRSDVKQEMKTVMTPIVQMILDEIYPYVYMTLVFVFVTFCFIVALFVMVYRLRSSRLVLSSFNEKMLPSKM